MNSVNPPRILRIITRMNTGGPSRQVSLLSSLPEFDTYTVWGVCGADESEDQQRIQQINGKREQIPFLVRQIHPWKDLLTLIRLIGIIQSYRPHIVHTHTAKAGMLGRLAAWWCRVPVIVHTYHGHVLDGYFSKSVSRFYRWIERQCGRISHAIIVLSPRQYDAITHTHGIGSGEKNHIIPLGIDLKVFEEGPRKPEPDWYLQRNLSPDIKYILWCGRLTGIKNPLILTEICSALKRFEDLPQWKILVAGDGELKEKLEQQISKYDYHDCIQLLSWETDTVSLFGAAEVVLLTSFQEGTPVSLIEAMAASCPIVATAAGGVPDMLAQGGGRVYPSGDVEGLSLGLYEILKHPDWGMQMGEIGQKQSRMYRIERLREDLSELYRNLLQRTFSPPSK